MKTLGAERVQNTLKTKNGNDKKLSTTGTGMFMIVKEALRLYNILSAKQSNHRPIWYSEISEDDIASIIYLLCSKISLYDTNIKWKRHSVILKAADNIFNGSRSMGLACVEWVVKHSELFTRASKLQKNKSIVSYSINPALSEQVIQAMNYRAANAFYCLPMTEKPVEWKQTDDGFVGGYRTKQLPLVKGITRPNVSDNVIESLNAIQSTAWKINTTVLRALKADIKQPIKSDFITVEYPDIIGEMTQEQKEQVAIYYRQVGTFKSELGKYRAVKLALDIADRFQDEDTLYFPHNMDSRGRIYPLAIALHPQANDQVKGLLEFADTTVLTENGAEWAYSYLAALWGEDKLPFNERVEIGKTVIYNDYREADEPYQFLAIQQDMLLYEADNNTPLHTHIHIDASCSAIQWMSAITGDKSGLTASNVIPSADGTRQDIYTEVALEALRLAKLQDTEDYKYIVKCLTEYPRQYAKKVVMVKAYGGSLWGDTESILSNMNEYNNDAEYTNIKVAGKFAKLINEALDAKINGAKTYMNWAKKLAKKAAKDDSGVCYTTYDGFEVNIKKLKYVVDTVTAKVDGKIQRLNINIPTETINAIKTANAAAPSIIHSLDATLLRMVAKRARITGIGSMGFIHDAFAATPNKMDELLQIVKDCFIELNPTTICSRLAEQLGDYADQIGLVGTFDIKEVQNSEYFFS